MSDLDLRYGDQMERLKLGDFRSAGQIDMFGGAA